MISVNTENTETMRGWVFYDAECAFCHRWAARADELLARRGFHLAPLQAEWAVRRLGLKPGEPLAEMKLLTADGRVFGGADAVIHLARFIWWAWPVFVLAQIPGVRTILRGTYRWVAKSRACLGGQCSVADNRGAHHRHLTSSFYDLD